MEISRAVKVELKATPRLAVTPAMLPCMASCAWPRAAPMPRTVPMKPMDGMAQVM